MIPTLADNTPYIHGMDIYDIDGNIKQGDYISRYYALKYFDSFDVTIDDKAEHHDAGWYLCHINTPVMIGFDYAIDKFFSTKEAANKASNEQHAAMLKARIAELEAELEAELGRVMICVTH